MQNIAFRFRSDPIRSDPLPMKIFTRISLLFLLISSSSGCLSPIALSKAAEVYDDAAIRAESKQLLTNIARAQHHEPLTFERSGTFPASAISPEGLFKTIDKDFTVNHDGEKNTYTLNAPS